MLGRARQHTGSTISYAVRAHPRTHREPPRGEPPFGAPLPPKKSMKDGINREVMPAAVRQVQPSFIPYAGPHNPVPGFPPLAAGSRVRPSFQSAARPCSVSHVRSSRTLCRAAENAPAPAARRVSRACSLPASNAGRTNVTRGARQVSGAATPTRPPDRSLVGLPAHRASLSSESFHPATPPRPA